MTRSSTLLTAALAGVVAAVIAPATADARCRSATHVTCFCASETVGEVVTESIEGDVAEVALVADARSASDAGLTQGAKFSTRALNGERVGDHSFAIFRAGEVERRLPLQSDGDVVCTHRHGEFPVARATAEELAFSATCHASLFDAGFVEPVCNDTGPGPVGGCTSTGSASDVALLALLALAVAVLRRT